MYDAGGHGELIGARLAGKWRIDARLGVGGMATVYAATHRNGRRAAIKLLRRDLAADPDVRARFLREGYVANRVGHPGVCTVLDDHVDGDRVFLVLELLDGETLRERWVEHGRRMPVAEVVRVALGVLDVLVAAHARGIVHRDLKPENVWLARDGGVRVLDFGIARVREATVPRTLGEHARARPITEPLPLSATGARLDATLGTPAYMAPEQARGLSDDIDGRTDVYGLGATMFTLLTGDHVHARDGSTALFIAAATEPARPIRGVMPELAADVAAVIDRALSFDAAARFTAREMQDALLATLRAAAVADEAAPSSRARSRGGLERRGPASHPPVAASLPPPRSRSPRSAAWAKAALAVAGIAVCAWTAVAMHAVLGAGPNARATAASRERASTPSPSGPRSIPAPRRAAPFASTAASASASAAPARAPRRRGGDGLHELP
jgi:serine/threonine protein kinase